MEDYKIGFDLDSKIAWNRQMIKEVFDKYKKIEIYYSIFLGYLGFIGLYTFDYIIEFFKHDLQPIDLLLGLNLILHLGLLIYIFYLIFQIISLKSFGNDLLPSDVYEKTKANVINDNPNAKTKKILKITKRSYLKTLEAELSRNYKIYEKKKALVKRTVILIAISIVIYFSLIIVFKFYDMAKKENKPKKTSETPIRRTDEGKEPKENKPLITEQGGTKKTKNVLNFNDFLEKNSDKIRKIVREEIDDYLEGKEEDK